MKKYFEKVIIKESSDLYMYNAVLLDSVTFLFASLCIKYNRLSYKMTQKKKANIKNTNYSY